MQRVSSLLPSWDRNRSSASSFTSNHTRKNSADKVRGWADIIPSSRSSRLAKEAFWPSTLDKECEKAARILKSFCCTLAQPTLMIRIIKLAAFNIRLTANINL